MNFGIKSENMLNYFLSDPAYLNEATYYSVAFLGIHLNSIKEFRADAIKRYIELSDYLEVALDTSIIKEVSNYTQYLGLYKDAHTTLHIKKEANDLKGTFVRNIDTTEIQNFTLYLDSKTYFTTPSSFGKLIYNNNNEVSDIVLSTGARQHRWQKIK